MTDHRSTTATACEVARAYWAACVLLADDAAPVLGIREMHDVLVAAGRTAVELRHDASKLARYRDLVDGVALPGRGEMTSLRTFLLRRGCPADLLSQAAGRGRND